MPNKKSLNNKLKEMGFTPQEHSVKNGKKKKHLLWVNEDLKKRGCPFATHGECLGSHDSGRENFHLDKLSKNIENWKTMVESAGSK